MQKTPERILQQAVHKILSDPSIVRTTGAGRRLQVLSPGRLNVNEGPDFLDIAMLLEGTVIVGNAEFHRNTSDWQAHNHDQDERYKSVILHIAFKDNSDKNKNIEILLLNEGAVEAVAYNLSFKKEEDFDFFSFEDLQDYALLRLLRKTADARKILNFNSLEYTLKKLTEDFLNRYNSRRKRPVYKIDDLNNLPQHIIKSDIYNFLQILASGRTVIIPDKMIYLMKEKISIEGSHLRRELILNCILPLALCLAGEEARINLFLWYWSTPALNIYGILKRRFENIPQNYLWQQQGMLEYLVEHGKKPGVVSDTVRNYGFAEVLTFFKHGRALFDNVLYSSE